MKDIPISVPANPTKFLDRLRVFIRTEGLSYSTEQTYVGWVRHFILFHHKRHPEEMGTAEIRAFLDHLVLSRNVAANTQRTALNALVFLYKRFLQREVGQVLKVRANRHRRIPVVFSHQEALSVLAQLEGVYKLAVQMLYGCGLRLNEALRLRVQDIDFSMSLVIVRDGKGAKDRRTLLPQSLIEPLLRQIASVKHLHQFDLSNDHGEVYLPYALSKKYPNALSWLPALGMGLSVPLYALGFLLDNLWLAVPCLMVAAMIHYFYLGPMYAVSGGVVDSRMRATSVAITLFVVNLLGYGLGPPIIGVLSTYLKSAFLDAQGLALTLEACKPLISMAPDAKAMLQGAELEALEACSVAEAKGLQWSMVIFSCIYGWAALHYLLAGRTLQRDMVANTQS
mgnify:CR=1 FL=1